MFRNGSGYIDNNKLLQEVISSGIIDIEAMKMQLEDMRKNEYFKQHKNKIWQGKNGDWYTYIPDEKKGRILLKRKSESALKEAIIQFYGKQEENPTIHALFSEWVNGKLSRNEIQKQTKDRYENDFNLYFQDIMYENVLDVTEYDIEEFLLNSISKHNLTQKAFSNMKTLVFGIFKLAKKKRIINYSITEIIHDMEISRKCFRKIIKTDEQEVFSEEEMPIVINKLNDHLDLVNLGLLLVFKSGLRIGELCALKKEDISDNKIFVNRTETKYKNGNNTMVYEVRDFPKTEAGIRTVYLPDSAKQIINRIKIQSSFNEYVFEQNGERIRSYVFNNRLKTICKQCGIHPKSPHKIRKTCGTILLDNNVEESFILSQMGHTNINTTKNHYYRNRKSEKGKADTINHVVGL